MADKRVVAAASRINGKDTYKADAALKAQADAARQQGKRK